MKRRAYEVKYRVNNTNSRAILHLYSDSESQAIAELKSRGSVKEEDEIIILSIIEI